MCRAVVTRRGPKLQKTLSLVWLKQRQEERKRVGSVQGLLGHVVDSSLYSESIGQPSNDFEREGVAFVFLKDDSAILMSRSDMGQNEGEGCTVFVGLDKAAADGDVGK